MDEKLRKRIIDRTIGYIRKYGKNKRLGTAIIYELKQVKLFAIPDVIQWVAVEDELPPILETIWLSNGKGWADLGCRVEDNDGWYWAGQNGIIYQEKDQIVAECETDDLDVVYWCKLPKPPCA